MLSFFKSISSSLWWRFQFYFLKNMCFWHFWNCFFRFRIKKWRYIFLMENDKLITCNLVGHVYSGVINTYSGMLLLENTRSWQVTTTTALTNHHLPNIYFCAKCSLCCLLYSCISINKLSLHYYCQLFNTHFIFLIYSKETTFNYRLL